MDKSKYLMKAENVLNYWRIIEFLAQDRYDAMWEVQKKVKNIKAAYGKGESTEKALWDYVELQKPLNLYDVISKEAALCGMQKWGNVTVYIGKMKREACIECIARLLSDDEKRCEQAYDEIAWASFQITPEGTYKENTLSLSPVIWAMSKLGTGKRLSECIDEKEYESALKELEEEFFGRRKDAPPVPVYGTTLRRLFDVIEKRFIKDNIDRTEAEVYQENYGLHFQLFLDEDTKKKREDDNYIGLSHAYFLSDIRIVSNAVENGRISEEMLHYIDILGKENECQPVRIDMVSPKVQEKDIFLRRLLEILEVKNAPLGKWPSRYMPALMQQVAVNLSTKKGQSHIWETNGTVFSVNGPPGTGKTTLLKEIVTGNIIERAALLAQYENPDSAFERHPFLHGESERGAYYKYVRYWNSLKDERINEYGILVASCNNAAVENVTKELPVYSGIYNALQAEKDDDEELRKQLKEIQTLFDAEQCGEQELIEECGKNDIYFTEYAKALLKNDDVWGLIAAPLGKKSNLSDFYFHVLYPLNRDFYKRNRDIENRLEKYQNAREKFLCQLEKVRGMQSELQKICDLVRQRSEERGEVCTLLHKRKCWQEECEASANNLIEERKTLERKRTEREEQLEKALKVKEEAALHLKKHEIQMQEQSARKREYLEKETKIRDSVGFLERLFKKSAYIAKTQLADEYHTQAEMEKMEYQRMREEITQIRSSLEQAERVYNSAAFERQNVMAEISRKEDEISRLNEEGDSLIEQVEESIQRFETIDKCYRHTAEKLTRMGSMDTASVLDEKFVDELLSEDELLSVQAHVKNPWFTERYNREREKLFYLAMKLNKEFVLASKRCRDNLITLSQYWGLKNNENNERISFAKEDREAFAAALYQTLFLLVPVLSSTFASMGTFLRDMKEPQSLGTLIVDEAGQAQPQMAVGALFRCRKAVIVGDPKQVEPVVTDDLKLLKKTFDDEELRPYKSKIVSVQNFADKMNGFGTYLDNGTDYPEWVGCPLVVHRRCISPMYDISNQISYNGIMKQQTRKPSRAKTESFVFDRSQWINVAGKERGKKDHFVEAQGQKVCDILEIAIKKAAEPDLFIISPFTSVVRGIKKYISERRYAEPNGSLSEYKAEWLNSHIGTVHTFQGKEAAEVIFLLGCDKSKEAAGAVRWVNANIVNVAATRAKYRLYVIGDEAVWCNSEVVNRAKNIINTFAIRQIKTIMEQDMPEDDKRKALAEASESLPPATSFHTDISESESGECEYSVNTEGVLSALKSEFMEEELTEEQIHAFGFESVQSLKNLAQRIQENLQVGIRLYFLLKSVYDANQNLDASCCSILFCKAIELQMKECFGKSLKRMFPKYKVAGKGNLEKVDIDKLTLGNFMHIIDKGSDKLADKMKEKGEQRYNVQWWKQYKEKLKKCTGERNKCCHSGLFTWEDQKMLIHEIFQEETPVMKGLLFEAEVGKRI